MSKGELRLEAIKGHAGDQLEIEEILNKGGTLAEYQLKGLPDCSQRLEYARRSFQNAMKEKNYFSGTDVVGFLPEDEMVVCLEEIIRKSNAINRTQWADDAIKAFPRFGKWGDRRKELLEDVIKRNLDAGIPHWANDVAKEIPRELTLDELETVIAKCLKDDFSSAEIAVGIAKRSFTVDELRIAIKNAKSKKNWSLVLKIAQMLPIANSAERETLINEAHQVFINAGDSSGISEVCKIQGNRKMGVVELKVIFEKKCSDSNMMLNGVAYYAQQLAKYPVQIVYLEGAAEALIGKSVENALDIALTLPETSTKKVVLLETIGAKALQHQQEGLIKKCAVALLEGNDVRTKLARYLVSEASKKFGEFDVIKDGRDVEKALEAVKLLPRGNEKMGHLQKLYVSAKKIEDGLDRRSDLSPSGFHGVKAELNRCA